MPRKITLDKDTEIPGTEVLEPKAKARISVLERRLQNPFGEPSAPIELKDASRECRWFNAAIMTDKIWRAKAKGWDPVRPDDCVDLDQVAGYVKNAEGFVTRGDRGQELLMSMPKDWRRQIAIAKTRENNKNMGDSGKTKAEVVSAFAEKYGDEAGTTAERHVGPVGSVIDQFERVERRPDTGE
jgi:hypothetical protein